MIERGLLKEAAEWKWSSFRHYALREARVVEIESAWTAADQERRVRAGFLAELPENDLQTYRYRGPSTALSCASRATTSLRMTNQLAQDDKINLTPQLCSSQRRYRA
jgi:hypothetical protein